MSSFARSLIKEREGWWNSAGAREFKDIFLSEVWNREHEKRQININNNFVRAARVDGFR